MYNNFYNHYYTSAELGCFRPKQDLDPFTHIQAVPAGTGIKQGVRAGDSGCGLLLGRVTSASPLGNKELSPAKGLGLP